MSALRIFGLDGLFLAVGLASLYGLGLVRSRGSALRLAGLALLSGWALVGVGTTLMLTAGAAGTAPQVALLAVVLGGAALALWKRVRPLAVSRGWRSSTPARALAAGGLLLLLASLEEILRSIWHAQPARWDAWAFWVPKAEALVYTGGLHTGPGTIESFANPDYPPLVPTLDATVFRFAGKVDAGLLPVQHWVLGVALFAALAGLLWHRVAPEVLFPGLAVMSMLPVYQHDVGSLLGDETLLTAFALAGVAAALWLLEREPRYLALYALFGSAMALAKNEGFTYVLAIGAVLVVIGLLERPRPALLLAALPPLAMLPWKLWSRAHHVPPSDYYRFSNVLHPDYLADRAGRLWHTLRELPQYYTAFDRWLLTLPVAAVLVALAARRRPALAVFVAATVVVGFVGNVVVYWISPAPLDWYISTSAERTATGPLVFLAALCPLLAFEALTGRRVEAAEPEPAAVAASAPRLETAAAAVAPLQPETVGGGPD